MVDGGDSESARILLVDDNPEILALLKVFLAGEGYALTAADNGVDALLMARESVPDLILLDVDMPNMDGYEVCRRLQLDPALAFVPVIFATGLSNPEDKRLAFTAGGVDHISKPLHREDLVRKVRTHLNTTVQWAKMRPGSEGAPGTPGDRNDFVGFLRRLADTFELTPEQAGPFLETQPKRLWAALDIAGIPRADIASQMAAFLNLQFVPAMSQEQVSLGALPLAFCKANAVVPINRRGGGTAFVTSNPFDLETHESLQFAAKGQPLEILVTEPESLTRLFDESSLSSTKSESPSTTETKNAVTVLDFEPSDTAGEPENARGLEESAAQAPVVRLVNEILVNALELGASDIHIEPRRDALAVRLRRDGVLQESTSVGRELAAAVISRIKILCNLDIAERRLPQDGHARFRLLNRDVDVRVSTLPTRHGEKVVMRILDRSGMSLELSALGLDPAAIKEIRSSTHRPNGLVLLTGPTGSGKTTTLYAALQDLNAPGANIVTAEDPVEYELERVNQVEVHPEAGLTFPTVLRSVLRQDPDIILIGEIRDRETADIAVKAALSGHLVLSTLHTNDAASTIARLNDMGVEPFLLASSLQMVVAQRLLRRLCDDCKQPVALDDETLERLGCRNGEVQTFYQARGCSRCNHTGFRGRVVVVEIMVTNEALRGLISKAASTEELRKCAAQELKMSTLWENALARARAGETSLEEVVRVIGSAPSVSDPND